MCEDIRDQEEMSDEEYARLREQEYEEYTRSCTDEYNRDIPFHKRPDYAERMADAADMRRQQMKDDRLIEQMEAMK